jgi:hypothetical protein
MPQRLRLIGIARRDRRGDRLVFGDDLGDVAGAGRIRGAAGLPSAAFLAIAN